MHLHNSFFGTKLQVVKPYKIASLFLYTFSSTNLLFIWANNLYNNFIKQFYKIYTLGIKWGDTPFYMEDAAAIKLPGI